MDQCRHCQLIGDSKACSAADCGKHADWIVREHKKRIAELKAELTTAQEGIEAWKLECAKASERIRALEAELVCERERNANNVAINAEEITRIRRELEANVAKANARADEAWREYDSEHRKLIAEKKAHASTSVAAAKSIATLEDALGLLAKELFATVKARDERERAKDALISSLRAEVNRLLMVSRELSKSR